MKRTKRTKQRLTTAESSRLLLILIGRGRFCDGRTALKAIETLLGMFSRAELVQILLGPDAAVDLSSLEPELIAKLAMPVHELDISVRTANLLVRAGIRYVYKLVQNTPDELMQMRLSRPRSRSVDGFRRKSIDALNSALAKLDLTLGMTPYEATIAEACAEIERKEAAGK